MTARRATVFSRAAAYPSTRTAAPSAAEARARAPSRSSGSRSPSRSGAAEPSGDGCLGAEASGLDQLPVLILFGVRCGEQALPVEDAVGARVETQELGFAGQV